MAQKGSSGGPQVLVTCFPSTNGFLGGIPVFPFLSHHILGVMVTGLLQLPTGANRQFGAGYSVGPQSEGGAFP